MDLIELTFCPEHQTGQGHLQLRRHFNKQHQRKIKGTIYGHKAILNKLKANRNWTKNYSYKLERTTTRATPSNFQNETVVRNL